MNKTMWKTTLREIRQSFGRYMAILAIVALGVGLFAGLKIMKPLMIETADRYLKEKGLFDFQLVSTYGFEQEDVAYLASLEEVRAIQGTYTYDVLYQLGADENTNAMRVHTLTNGMNELRIVAGELPKNPDECVVDSDLCGEDAIGQKIYLTDMNEEDTLENFAVKEFTITGLADASSYMQHERGNTSIGNGKISGFMYVPIEAFDSDVYTEIYVKFHEDFPIYSEEYKAFIEEKEVSWKAFTETSVEQRFERVQTDAYEELEEAKEEFETEKAKAQDELNDAKVQLADAAKEIKDGKQKIADGKKELSDGKKQIADGKKEIQDGYDQLASNEAVLKDGAQQIADNKILLEEKEAELAAGIEELNANQAVIDANKKQLDDAMSQLNQALEMIEASEDVLLEQEESLLANEQMLLAKESELTKMESMLQMKEKELQELEAALKNGMIPEEEKVQTEAAIASGKAQVESGKAQLLAGKAEIEAGKTEIALGKAQIEEQRKPIVAGLEQIAQGQAQLDSSWSLLEAGKAELEAGKAELASNEKLIVSGLEQLEAGRAELAAAEDSLKKAEKDAVKAEKQLADAEEKLKDGEKEYLEGRKEYEDGLLEYETEIADAEAEIADAEQEIKDMEDPEGYVLGRDTNVGYVCLDNDSSIVKNVADVFPVFFFLIAALVCMTTMNRMIEEQRTQIGILKALGYSRSVIMGKYLFYSGSAAGIGCAVGYFIGTYFLTKIIWMAYGMMYNIGDLVYFIDWPLAIVSLVCSMACSMGVTYFSCKVELNEVAASLMRPKAPKAGKRVFLEYVPFIWNRLSFLVKVSIRNVFRYKKRFFMMIVGISGSMALLVTGFGIQDSISDVVTMQYDEIHKYHISASFQNEPNEEELKEVEQILKSSAKEYALFMEGSLDLTYEGNTKAVSYVIPKQSDSFAKYIDLHTLDGDPIAFPKKGEAVVSHKLCENYKIRIGDTITLMDEDHITFEVVVSGICQNFVSNYVFLHPDTCAALWKAPEFKTIYVNVLPESEEIHQLSANVMAMEDVTNVVVNEDVKERFNKMMSTMDYLVVVIIMCAAALAFIVLYNLTNINITERIREIATIKVLGFNKQETAAYVFRENIGLTAVGSIAGLFLGKLFHAFVMKCVNVDMVAFDVRIKPISYVYSLLLSFAFAWLVNWFMSGKLEKISMTESLKSVD